MTSLIDSAAHFESRLGELGLTAGLITNIKNHGVGTLSQLAFAVGQPGQPLMDVAVDQFIQTATGRPPAIGESAILKRAAFEAQTVLISTLRQNIEKTDEAPRKIAFAERTSRMQALQAALAGIEITGEQEAAHCVLDKACNIYESNTLKYLDPASCVSRSHEIQGITKNRELTFEKGSLVLKSGEDKLSSPTDSEIKVHYAMVRRGLSFQFARLMSYSQHCQWESFLLRVWAGFHIEQVFMIEVFAGTAVLSSVAKQFGLVSSLAVDKVRKRGARSTIFQLDLTCERDQCLLEQWMQSPLLLWVHLAPVCGTASRARDIRRFANDPKPLRSDEKPEGLDGLSERDQQRIRLANTFHARSS